MTKFNKLNNRRKKKLAKKIITTFNSSCSEINYNEQINKGPTPIPNVTDPVKTLKETNRLIELLDFYK